MWKNERRNTPRSPTAFKVECLQSGEVFVAQDISLGGMMITGHRPRWPGEMLSLRFRPPGQRRFIRATGRVVDLLDVPHGVGMTLRFLQLAPSAKLQIHHFVDLRPFEMGDDDPLELQVKELVGRIIDDCRELRALAQA